jgi:hypothetical protein
MSQTATRVLLILLGSAVAMAEEVVAELAFLKA